jgi:hypothetical protein
MATASRRGMPSLPTCSCTLALALVAAAATLATALAAPPAVRRHLEPQTYDPANPRGPYLGQKPPGLTPRVFAPGFVSTESGVEYSITLSPAGDEIYFSRYSPTSDRDTTWVTRQTPEGWTSPTVAEFATGTRDTEPFITGDGSRMYFVSLRQGGGSSTQLWSMTRGTGGWGTPAKLGSPFSANPKMYPTAAASGNLYFTEELSSTWRSIFMARRTGSGAFETPAALSSTVNAFASMGHALIAPDEGSIIFDAAGSGESYALHASFNGAGGTWLPSIRLGDEVNSGGHVTCPALSPDGKYLFFQRGGDIWWVDAKVVFDLKPDRAGGR